LHFQLNPTNRFCRQFHHRSSCKLHPLLRSKCTTPNHSRRTLCRSSCRDNLSSLHYLCIFRAFPRSCLSSQRYIPRSFCCNKAYRVSLCNHCLRNSRHSNRLSHRQEKALNRSCRGCLRCNCRTLSKWKNSR
jgi:hypothetical protein